MTTYPCKAQILCLLLTLLLTYKSVAQNPITAADSLALVTFYQQTKGPQWKKNSNWLNGPVSSWYGITVKNGRVTQIDFSSQRNGNNLNGNLPPELGKLTELIVLKLPGAISQKQLLTGPIPDAIGKLNNLINLDLSNNQLSGAVPASLGKLKNLTLLNLDYNQLSGTFPQELGSLVKLKYLSMAGNSLSGNLPAAMGNLTALQYLYLFENKFSGSIPTTVSNLLALEELQLADNAFTAMPAELGELINLKVLDLSGNQIGGNMPTSLGKLKKLEELYLNNNNLKGSVPDLSGLQNLTVLDLSYNQLFGKIPAGVWQLKQLSVLNVSQNNLEGTLADGTGNLTKAEWMGLSHNKFTGELPEGIGKLSRLQLLYLEGNQFSGSVPKTFQQLSRLRTLSLADNKLKFLPDLSSLNTLKNLYIERNQFSFDDILPNYSDAGFYYTPQDTVATTDTVTVQSGNEYTIQLDIDNGISTNTYQWYRNGNKIATTDTNQLTIHQAAEKDAGLYTSKISNTQINDLTLMSRSVYLQVQAGQLSQHITFASIPNKTFGDSAFALSVYSDSQLPVTLKFKGPVVLEGKSVTITGAGEVTVIAFQKGNDSYLPADSITLQFTVSKAHQTIAFDPIPDKALGDQSFAVKAVSDAALPISFEIVSGAALLEGNLLTPTHEGNITIRAYSTGNENYIAAETRQSFTVSKNIKKTQTITLDSISNKTFGDAPFTVHAVSNAGLPVSCEITRGPATLDSTLLTITDTGTVEVLALQSGNELYKADSVTQKFTVSKATQTITFDAIPDKLLGDTPFALKATASSGLPVTFSVTGSAVLDGMVLTLTDTGKVSITTAQAGNTNYLLATAITHTFKVKEAEEEKVVTGTHETRATENIKIYPNPSTDKFTVSLNIQEWKSGALIIRNLSGQLIKKTSINSAKIDVDLEKESAGLYLIILQKDQTQQVIRITKK